MQEQRRTKAPVVDIPLLGRIAAGTPVEAVEQHEVLNFADFAGNGDTFALEVRGNSMIDDHICDGDVILLERVTQARDGDIVVALVAGSDTTLKRFYREPGDMVRLQPANATHQANIGSCKGCADSGPAAGRAEKVQISEELTSRTIPARRGASPVRESRPGSRGLPNRNKPGARRPDKTVRHKRFGIRKPAGVAEESTSATGSTGTAEGSISGVLETSTGTAERVVRFGVDAL